MSIPDSSELIIIRRMLRKKKKDGSTHPVELVSPYHSMIQRELCDQRALHHKHLLALIDKHSHVVKGSLNQFLSTPIKSDHDEVKSTLQESYEQLLQQVGFQSAVEKPVTWERWIHFSPVQTPFGNSSVLKNLIKRGNAILARRGIRHTTSPLHYLEQFFLVHPFEFFLFRSTMLAIGMKMNEQEGYGNYFDEFVGSDISAVSFVNFSKELEPGSWHITLQLQHPLAIDVLNLHELVNRLKTIVFSSIALLSINLLNESNTSMSEIELVGKMEGDSMKELLSFLSMEVNRSSAVINLDRSAMILGQVQ
jgi:hypothetical protein